jgi:GNAT superfamily N-acetyltransferase
MEIKIRKAERKDVALIYEFIKGIAEFEKLSDAVKSSPEILAKTIFDSGIPIKVIFAEVDNTEVAFAVYYFNFSTFTGKPGLFLEDLFVKPEYRKKGIGKMLMDYLIDEAKQMECGRMEWTALKWNPACDFYEEQFGAEPLDEWKIYRLSF